MRDYKADITLNEEDSLIDLLNAEKNLLKTYSVVISESVSKGVRGQVLKNLKAQIESQISVFFLMTELDYYRVNAASDEERREAREKFRKSKQDIES